MESFLSAPSPPSSAFSTDTAKSRFYLPLSNHGMPKTPGNTRSHRFSTVGTSMSPSFSSTPATPMSPMSPPMSAKSFGTFIDSEPSTPAYSPRMGSTWDSSTLVLLSPASSAPSSPVEPAWEMMAPVKRTKKPVVNTSKSPIITKQITIGTSLSSHPITPLPIQPESQKENLPPAGEESESKEAAEQSTQAAPLVGKLATRMKSILRRKTVSEKKSEKRRKGYQEFDRLEDEHWTEM